jgi:predicted thioesterase
MEHLTPGLSGDLALEVTEAHTAAHWGSGLVPVFATPALVGLMEGAAVAALADHLPAGHTSVGGRIDVRHLAPTPVGMRVRAHAELIAVEGRKLSFRVEAWDERERIGTATHERFVIEVDPFVARAEAKASEPLS